MNKHNLLIHKKKEKFMSYLYCKHCEGRGNCNCPECLNKAGLDPFCRYSVICKNCRGLGKVREEE